MEALKLKKTHTFEEYLTLERQSSIKHEFHNGMIVAMAGGRAKHGHIIHNTSTAINNALGERDCRVYGDVKVRVEKANRSLYPDLFLICGDEELYDNHSDVLTNPSLIIEVLSPSTERYDRTQKFKFYRQLPSFKEYVLVSTDVPTVEAFYREEKGYWHINTAIGIEDSIHLKSIDAIIQLKDIYRRVKDLKDPQLFMDL